MPRIKSFIDTGHDGCMERELFARERVFAVRANGFIEGFDGILCFAETPLRHARP